jgi:hypothetical protein
VSVKEHLRGLDKARRAGNAGEVRATAQAEFVHPCGQLGAAPYERIVEAAFVAEVCCRNDDGLVDVLGMVDSGVRGRVAKEEVEAVLTA